MAVSRIGRAPNSTAVRGPHQVETVLGEHVGGPVILYCSITYVLLFSISVWHLQSAPYVCANTPCPETRTPATLRFQGESLASVPNAGGPHGASSGSRGTVGQWERRGQTGPELAGRSRRGGELALTSHGRLEKRSSRSCCPCLNRSKRPRRCRRLYGS
jgi:hypothetical protein